MADVPVSQGSESEPETRRITEGYFEEELIVDAKSAGAFLVELGTQLQESDEVTITGDGWEIPFPFAGPVELEIEFEGDDDPELEIEIELTGRVGKDKAPGVA